MFKSLKPIRKYLAIAAMALAPAAAWTPAASQAGDADNASPIVIELYTSQGCSSCPPADAFMGDLIKRKGILGLTFHVDYWDYIGWKDPFALPGNTLRQKNYANSLGLPHIFTPQMVVQGAFSTVGSSRWDVDRAIKQARVFPVLPVKLDHKEKNRLTIKVPAAATKEPARILLAATDDMHTTKVKSGENSGRALSYYNVVREIRKIGSWNGDEVVLTVAIDEMMSKGRGACAVLVQSKKSGHILGAAQIKLNHSI